MVDEAGNELGELRDVERAGASGEMFRLDGRVMRVVGTRASSREGTGQPVLIVTQLRHYASRFRLADGTEEIGDSDEWRELAVGDSRVMPIDADGRPESGSRHLWRVMSVARSTEDCVHAVVTYEYVTRES